MKKSGIKKIIVLMIVLIFLIPTAFIFYFLGAVTLSEQMARSLAPPEYPNSILIEDWESGGSVSMWDRKLYSTPDSPEQVLTFMESHVGEFKTSEHSETEQIRFSWGKCSRNVLLSFMVFVAETRPCASVSIFTDPDRPDVTLIRVWIDWPAP